MSTSTTTDRPRLSDRAHRIQSQLSRHHADGEWVAVASICDGLGLNSHEIRSALAELVTAGVAQRQRSFICRDGRRTHCTSFRLTDNTREVSA
ncbi:hypothetical protein [Streptomyces zaomyceticus]|uniref:hypothetical protein n=1 Tax=Streptomyces zaomyceticus TaxID=68286 RepID=UPI002E245D7B